MVVTCVLFLMLWLGYAWSWQGSVAAAAAIEDSKIQVRAPILLQHCAVHEVPCIDDCSFLCLEKGAQCIGGVCQPPLQAIPCNTKTGGVKMMVKDPVPHWTCVCSDSRFYRGDACDELNPDVCEGGTFFYQSRMRFVCVCPSPLELVRIDGKPHCVGPEKMGFYDPSTMNQNLL